MTPDTNNVNHQTPEQLTKKQQAQQTAINTVKRISSIAGGINGWLTYVLYVGAAATVYLMWLLFSIESVWWWNAIKCGLVSVPVLIVWFFWSILAQLSEVPESTDKFGKDSKQLYADIKQTDDPQMQGFRGMLRALNNYRKEGSLFVMFDTVSGIAMLVNPFFLVMVCLSFVMLFMFTLIALLIVLF